MPNYQYKCPKCGNEHRGKAKPEDPNPACPKCTTTMEKVPSKTSFQLKGGGWYAQGYGS